MAGGIRATVEFPTGDVCPIAAHSADAATTITRVGSSVPSGGSSASVSEFSSDAALEADEELTPVFTHGADRRYRLEHDPEASCPCAALGELGCPVARYTARNGTLTIVFHARDYAELQETVATLRERFPALDIKRFVRSPGEDEPEHVLVDRGKLTARQLEILERAHEMGYFERPRRANASEVADALDIDPSTFSEHLARAQLKLFEDLL